MRKLRVWGLGAVLFAGGLGMSAAMAADTKDAEEQPSAKSGWNWNVFGSKDKPAAATDKPKAEPEPPKPVRPDPATILKQERDKLMRRTAACLRLQEIALQTNDAELQRVADQLSDRAYQVYLQRTANVGGGAMLPESTGPAKTVDTHAISGPEPKEN